MLKNPSSYCLTLLVLLFHISALATDEAPPKVDHRLHSGEALGFYLENDSRNIGGPGADQAYSNGLKLSYIYAEDRVPSWSKGAVQSFRFLDQKLETSKANFGLSLGHQIYTPNKTNAPGLISDDRPYAAWLYLGFAASFKEESVGYFLELDFGVVGPSALGKEVQNNFHDAIHQSGSDGWNNSLRDEPTIQLFYQKRFRSYNTRTFDFFPYYGLSFGNVQIGAHIGGLVRFGTNLPDDFGPSRPSASDGDSFVTPATNPKVNRKSFYVFAGGRGNLIARNIFLDGNSFQHSHHVTKYPTNFESEFGAGTQVIPFALVWRFVTRSPEFEERSIFNSFASISLIYFL